MTTTANDDAEIRTWRHSRKGTIRGTVVSDDGEWVRIRLAGDHTLTYGSEANRGRVDEDAEILTVRKALMTEVHDA